MRKAAAWRSLNNWKAFRNPVFLNTSKSLSSKQLSNLLFYGCESWFLKPTLQKSLDVCCTWVLLIVLNSDQNQQIPNEHLVWWATEASWQSGLQKEESLGPLPLTPGTSSEQAGALGTVTHSPTEKTPYAYICGRIKEGHQGGELCRPGTLCGGREGLDSSTEHLTMDDLMISLTLVDFLMGFEHTACLLIVWAIRRWEDMLIKSSAILSSLVRSLNIQKP